MLNLLKAMNSLTAGKVLHLTRMLRKNNKSLKEARDEIVLLLAEIDRRGFDADIVLRRKRGRPSNLSRFLSVQKDLL